MGRHSLNPRTETFDNRGLAYGKGQYDRAIQDYDQAIKLNPTNTLAFNNRGVAYYRASRQVFEEVPQVAKLPRGRKTARGADHELAAQ